MIISVFGLGYVGVVSAACLTDDGHTVIGVDTNQDKVDLINSGKSPIIEEHIGGLIADGVQSGLLSATIDSAAAIRDSDLAFVCGNGGGRSGSGRFCERVLDAAYRAEI